MAIFNNLMPVSQIQPKARTFQSNNWWTGAKLAFSGSNKEGGQNAWGKIADVGLPAVLSIVGGYYLGPAGSIAGSKIGSLANKGLNSWGNNIMEGTDSQITYQQTTQKEEKNDALVEMAGSLLGNIASGLNTSSLGGGEKAASGSGDSKGIGSMFSAKNTDKLSAYQRIFGTATDGNSPVWAQMGNRLISGIDVNSSIDRVNEQMFNYNTENRGLQSSIIPDTTTGSSDIKFLDERKRTTAPSSLPYNQFSGFSRGGQTNKNGNPFAFYAGGGSTFNGPSEERNGIKFYSNVPTAPVIDEEPTASMPDYNQQPATGTGKADIKTRISMAEGSFNKRNPYGEQNSVGPGHYGKYQLTPALVYKFAPGLSLKQFMDSPEAQEGAMDRLLDQYKSEVTNIRRQTGTNWDDDSLLLLTHFQGSPKGIEMLKNPASLNKSTKNNPSVMDYIGKRSFGVFAKGSAVMPFQFYEAGSEVMPLSDGQIRGIRNHYNFEGDDTVNPSGANLIIHDGLNGNLPVDKTFFSGLPGSDFIASLINRNTGKYGNSNGNLRVRAQQVGSYGVGTSTPQNDPMLMAKVIDKKKHTNPKFPSVSKLKYKSPFAFFADGGTSMPIDGKK